MYHYKVRSWDGWYRNVTSALFAHAFLAVMRQSRQDAETLEKGEPNQEVVGTMAEFKRKRGL